MIRPMKTILIIVSAPAYGSERMLSALRLACALQGQDAEAIDLRLFLLSDAVVVGLPGQTHPDAGSSLQSMLESLVEQGVEIRLCRTCVEARGIADLALIPGVRIGTMPELANWTLSADKVISF